MVEYTRDANGRIEQVDTVYNTVTYGLADAITYMPFGPLNAITYGNNLEHTRGYDLDYRVTQLITGDVSTLQTLAYTYDDANNITGITNVLDGSRTQAFNYDDLNRLTGASGIYGSHAYTYDANGNRQTQTIGMATDTYSYVSSTHRLNDIDDGMTTQTFSYDNNGNTTSDGTHDLIYGDNNRIATVEVSSTPVAGYVYNGKGERVIKDVTDPILYYYDQNGQLLAELDENGNVIREYAWLDGQPLAVMSGAVILNYHNDHLGTPQMLTDDFQGVVWAADYEPFGKATVTTSTATNNLRFPGQYFDDETGLHYNYFRDYDPSTGRYVQSDPIGISAGTNTYAYVKGNPLIFADPMGLVTVGGPVKFDWTKANGTTYCGSNGRPTFQIDPSLSDCIKSCVIEHEQDHLDYINKTEPGICCGNLDRSLYWEGQEGITQETRASKRQLQCLVKKLSTASSNCRIPLLTEKNRVENKIKGYEGTLNGPL